MDLSGRIFGRVINPSVVTTQWQRNRSRGGFCRKTRRERGKGWPRGLWIAEDEAPARSCSVSMKSLLKIKRLCPLLDKSL
jgi:hypothetical protein